MVLTNLTFLRADDSLGMSLLEEWHLQEGCIVVGCFLAKNTLSWRDIEAFLCLVLLLCFNRGLSTVKGTTLCLIPDCVGAATWSMIFIYKIRHFQHLVLLTFGPCGNHYSILKNYLYYAKCKHLQIYPITKFRHVNTIFHLYQISNVVLLLLYHCYLFSIMLQ